MPAHQIKREAVRARLLAWLDEHRDSADLHLPSERLLAKHLDASRSLLSLVMNELIAEGRIKAVSPRVRRLVSHHDPGDLRQAVLIIADRHSEAMPRFGCENSRQSMVSALIGSLAARDLRPVFLRPEDDAFAQAFAQMLSRSPLSVIALPVSSTQMHRCLAVVREAAAADIPTWLQTDWLPQGTLLPDNVSTFRADQRLGQHLLVEWLVRHGLRRLLRIHEWNAQEQPLWLAERNGGHADACAALRIADLPAITHGGLRRSREPGDEFIAELSRLLAGLLVDRLDRPGSPDALLGITDAEITPLVLACRLLGANPLARPRVLGFDGYWWTSHYTKELQQRHAYEPPISVTFDMTSMVSAMFEPGVHHLIQQPRIIGPGI